MKRFFVLSFLIAIGCTTSLQAMFWPYMPWDDSYNDRYFIGAPPTQTPYITANEYAGFLMQYAPYDGEVGGLQFYWDSKYMDPKSPDFCIIRSYANDSSTYDYTVKAGCENKRISYVSSYAVAQEISSWRKKPTMEELIKYISAMSEVFDCQQKNLPHDSCWNEAQQIKQRYLGTPLPLILYNPDNSYPNNDTGNPDFFNSRNILFNSADQVAHIILMPQPNHTYVSSGFHNIFIKKNNHYLCFKISDFYRSCYIFIPFPQSFSCEAMMDSLEQKNKPWLKYERISALLDAWE